MQNRTHLFRIKRTHQFMWPILTVFWLFLILFLFSCQPKPQSTLRIATNVWPGYEPIYLARSLHLYDSQTIRLVEMKSASQVSHAIRNGTVEAAALTLDETLNLMQNNDLDLRVILVMDISNGADALLANPSINSLAELRGKRIGVENTATGAVVLDAALQKANLQAKEVDIISMTVNDHIHAWQSGQIDAVVTFDPVRSTLINDGAKILFDSSQISGRILDVLVVRAETITHHKAALKSLVFGYFVALDYLKYHTPSATKIMATRLQTDPSQVIEQFNGLQIPNLDENHLWLSGSEPLLNSSAQNLVQLMRKQHLLENDLNLNSLADAAFLPEKQNEPTDN